MEQKNNLGQNAKETQTWGGKSYTPPPLKIPLYGLGYIQPGGGGGFTKFLPQGASNYAPLPSKCLTARHGEGEDRERPQRQRERGSEG